MFLMVGFKKSCKVFSIIFKFGHVSFIPKFYFSSYGLFGFNEKFTLSKDSLMITHSRNNLGLLVEIQIVSKIKVLSIVAPSGPINGL